MKWQWRHPQGKCNQRLLSERNREKGAMSSGNVIVRGVTSLTKELLTTFLLTQLRSSLCFPAKITGAPPGHPAASLCSSPEQLAGNVRFESASPA